MTFTNAREGARAFVDYQENGGRDLLNVVMLLLFFWVFWLIALFDDLIILLFPDTLPPAEADGYFESGQELWWWLLSLPQEFILWLRPADWMQVGSSEESAIDFELARFYKRPLSMWRYSEDGVAVEALKDAGLWTLISVTIGIIYAIAGFLLFLGAFNIIF